MKWAGEQEEEESIKKSNRGLLVLLTIFVSVAVIAIVIATTFDAPQIEGDEGGFSLRRVFLYIKYYLLEFIALLFMQR